MISAGDNGPVCKTSYGKTTCYVNLCGSEAEVARSIRAAEARLTELKAGPKTAGSETERQELTAILVDLHKRAGTEVQGPESMPPLDTAAIKRIIGLEKKVCNSGLVKLLGGARLGSWVESEGLPVRMPPLSAIRPDPDKDTDIPLSERRDGGSGGGTALGIGGLGRGGLGDRKNDEFDLGGSYKTRFVPDRSRPREGGLPQDVVGRIIRRHWNEIKYCYEKELARNPGAYGQVTIFFRINAEGAVEIDNEFVRKDTIGSQEMVENIKAQVARWKFPAPVGGKVEVTYPFTFAAAE